MDGDDGENLYAKSRPRSRPSASQAMPILADLLTDLAALYPVKPEDWAARLKAYREDLMAYTVSLVDQAIRAGRKHWRYFPSIPEILEQIKLIENAGKELQGGMGFLGWDLYRAWIQAVGKLSPNLTPLPHAEMVARLKRIPQWDMVRMGTPNMLKELAPQTSPRT